MVHVDALHAGRRQSQRKIEKLKRVVYVWDAQITDRTRASLSLTRIDHPVSIA